MSLSVQSEEPARLVSVRLLGSNDAPSPPTEVPVVVKSEAEWLAQLGAARFRILRSSGTDAPFCGTLFDNKMQGIYLCAGCQLPLFASEAKFHSGTGWPSFFQPFAKENVFERRDASHGMIRIEVLCTRCDGHLGHIFPDGPEPTRLRFCLNSEALIFLEAGAEPPAAAAAK